MLGRLASVIALLGAACGSPAADPSTTLMDTLSGRPNLSESEGPIPVECGNGLREFGEACDEDDDVWGDGCNPDCTLSGATRWARSLIFEGQSPQHFTLDLTVTGEARLGFDTYVESGETVLKRITLHALDSEGVDRWTYFSDTGEHGRTLVGLTTHGEVTYFGEYDLSADTLSWKALDADGQVLWTSQPWFDETLVSANARLSTNGDELAALVTGQNRLWLMRIDRSNGELIDERLLGDDSPYNLGSLLLEEDGTMWAAVGLWQSQTGTIWRWKPGLLPRPFREEEGYYPVGLSIVAGDDYLLSVSTSAFTNASSIRRFSRSGELIDEVYPQLFDGEFGGGYWLLDFVPSIHGDYVGVHNTEAQVSRVRPDGGVRWAGGVDVGGLWPSQLEEDPQGNLVVAGLHGSGDPTRAWMMSLTP